MYYACSPDEGRGRESGLMMGTSNAVRWDGRMWPFDTGGGLNMLRLQSYVAWA
jgi:hypothetical protein